ncbi:coq1 putative hexaprenyl diphosphate synthase [Clydaea vesicula]|uniref:Coq1 putative hexaprenyl diphosphate synthase n=1 Tax=Clydaea vesicula TaxID=447962 RepID=A0AAD5U126_9FUNG|nr:coq1 putative hexaprenyl diphosphate synthase [Clydaea vesicula]
MTRDDKKFQLDQKTLDTPISSLDNSLLNNTGNPLILPSQKRLAEITEMIHTASLLHDDVIDTSFQRRSQPSANAEFGNKMAILAGDFLLARASTALARLRNVEVVELLATVISNLVEGEFMQLRNSSVEGDSKIGKFDYYLEKTYLKTASLIALSCKACVVLGGSGDKYSEMAFNYGKNVGLAFQLIDDMLDFVVTADQMGKPVNADLKLGLATAPILYAAETYPELWALIERKFAEEGDEKLALNLALKSDGIKRTKELAEKYIKEAVDSISPLPPSQAKDALIYLTHSVINRKK